ncbi:hypothetical protein BDR07DRAFT_293404 [Suillus spraguei]|nr:hypothetical protein BDR07DRAFT_293404 [Suillus spraguei]
MLAWGPMVVVHQPNAYAGGGYVQAPRGTRAIDEYNNTSPYAAPPRRKSSTLTQTTSSSTYPLTSTTHSTSPLNSYAVPELQSPPQCKTLLALTIVTHTPRRHMAMWKVASQHSTYNPWEPQQTQPSFNPDSYNASGAIAAASYATTYNPQPPQHAQSYAANATGAPQASDPYYTSDYHGVTNVSSSPPPMNTSAYVAPANTSGVKGPRGPPSPVVMSPPSQMYNDNPPTYEDGPSRTPVQWKN